MIHDPEHAWDRDAAEQLKARYFKGRAHSRMRHRLVHHQAINMYNSRDTSPLHVTYLLSAIAVALSWNLRVVPQHSAAVASYVPEK